MISITEALEIVHQNVKVLGSETVEIGACIGRVLAEDIAADTDLPPFDRSQMDGFAVIASDLTETPVNLKIVGESAAGRGWHKTMKSGQAVAIMTGAPVPAGADAVQKIELTRSRDWSEGGEIEILEPVKKGAHIVNKASEIKKGQVIFNRGEVITENMIATLAAFGYIKVKVGKRPRVAILGTGSEIVEINKRPGRDQIRNSNSVMLEAFSRRFASETTIFPIAKDDISNLKSQISEAVSGGKLKKGGQNPNILIITGGVSVGKYDHTKLALKELGAEIYFEKVRLKPGKPTVFARLGSTFVFGLPGNPVSAAVTFHLFVRTALLKMQNAAKTELKSGYAAVTSDAKAAKERDTYIPAQLSTTELGQLTANPLRWLGSSDFVGFARADSLIYVPKGGVVKAGEIAEIVYL